MDFPEYAKDAINASCAKRIPRAKLPNAGIRIVTVRGAGYRLEEA